jgi:hypothetical protein
VRGKIEKTLKAKGAVSIAMKRGSSLPAWSDNGHRDIRSLCESLQIIDFEHE